MQTIYFALFSLSLASCVKTIETDPPEEAPALAKVLSVAVSGEESAYRFNVEVESPDLGCDQYADWWEVITEEGALVYRRILAHSHVNEQPFKRSGSPVAISVDQVVFIRAHMNNSGYGKDIVKGSVAGGFERSLLVTDFAKELEVEEPLPKNCAF
ncbi:MAG: hypothetical protein AAF806_23955 [Bacteroidota bacterium]